MALADASVSGTLPSSGMAELPLRTIPQPSKQIELGSVQHIGDDVANPNNGVQVAGHVLGCDRSQMNFTTKNSYNYNLPSGAVFNIGAPDDRMVIISWLGDIAGLDFSCIHQANLSKREDGTGAWFLRDARFRAWYEGSMRTLWCHGMPGSGKTILSSIAIEHLEAIQEPATPDTACLFIFFNHQEKATQKPYRLFIELLRQLVSQKVELSDQVRRLYDQCKSRATSPTWDNLLDVMRQEIRRFSKVWLVVDALDECPANAKENTRGYFLGVIRNLPATVSLLVTSREREFTRYDLDPVHEVEIELHEEDLESYVRAQIRRHSCSNELLALANADFIIRSISRKAKGMFLLASLHMNDIAAQHTPADLKLALEHLPSDIRKTYDKARQRIPDHDTPLVERILLWITFAMRPLTVDELRWVLAVKEGVTNASTARLHMLEERDLTTLCAGLVTVDPDPPVRFVRLVHPTAERYFKEYFEHENAHSTLAATCIRHLLFEDLRLQIPDKAQIHVRLQELPFLPYAALHWGNHARKAQNPETVSLALEFFKQKMNLASVAQIMDFVDDSFSALWMAAHFGLGIVVDKLLLLNPDMLSEVRYGETAMHAAAEKGYLVVVDRLCLETDIEPDLTSEVGRTPLSLAAENGHHKVVQRLVSSGKVDPDSKAVSTFYQGRTPLSWAAGSGQTITVGHLLATDQVDVDSTTISEPYFGRTPLMWAAERGHTSVVELLLRQGMAKPGLEDGDGRTALSWAALNGHGSVVKLLLQTNESRPEKRDRGCKQRPVDLAYNNKHEEVVRLLVKHPELDFKDNEKRTSLSHEAEHGNVGLVKVLLDCGADPNSKSEEDWTPLTYAAEKGRSEVAKLLLESRADQEIQCADGRTPLSYASEGGHEEMVQLLLTRGAHPDTPDRYGRTPLSYAAESGHGAIVASLISLEKAVNPDSQSSGILAGRTPLSWAAGKGRNKVVEMLLKTGANVNLKKGAAPVTLQPIMWAASNGHEEVVRVLLETGRVELKTEDELFGRPASEWARNNRLSFIQQ